MHVSTLIFSIIIAINLIKINQSASSSSAIASSIKYKPQKLEKPYLTRKEKTNIDDDSNLDGDDGKFFEILHERIFLSGNR